MSVKTMLWLALAACGGGGGESPDPDAPFVPPIDAPRFGQRAVGNIAVLTDTKPPGIGAAFQIISNIDTRIDGPCEITRQLTPTATEVVDAGTVFVELGDTKVRIEPDPITGIYNADLAEAPAPGTIVAMGVIGDELGGFKAATLVPGTLQVTTAIPAVIHKNTGFSVGWLPLNDAVVVVSVFDFSDIITGVQCFFPADAQTGTVPASALAELPLGANLEAAVQVMGFRKEEVGSFEVGFAVVGNHVSASPVVAN